MIALVDTFTGAAGGGGGAGSSPTGGVHRTAPTSMYDTQSSPAALSATGATPGPGGYTSHLHPRTYRTHATWVQMFVLWSYDDGRRFGRARSVRYL